MNIVNNQHITKGSIMKMKKWYLVAATLTCACLISCTHITKKNSKQPVKNVTFTDVSELVGLITESNWKYGGPTISDLNNDGHYDLLLTNHDSTPIRLFMANGDNTYTLQPDIYPRVDLHGMASGDYDNDGDNDILIALGGGNGQTPQPQRLLRNDNGKFTDVTVESGLSKMGARGRSVRWVDLDNDGDLDFMQVNAAKQVNEDTPRNILFENQGNGQFIYHPSKEFENLHAERVLLSDYNNDGILDIFGFNGHSELSIYKGNNDFTFINVTKDVLADNSKDYFGTLAMAQADIDNDGDMDYYLARGKLHYAIANNSISFNDHTKRLDIRDEGNKSHDGITLIAEDNIILSDFYHFPRAKLLDHMPVYLGENKELIETPDNNIQITKQRAQGFPVKTDKTGWYIGYIGNGQWRVEWVLADNLAWDVRASFKNISAYKSDWTPQNLAIPDALLRNDNGKLVDVSDQLPALTNANNWGVVPGDFNNDTYVDFMVYRFGELKERIEDVLLLNNGDFTFKTQLAHNASTELGQDSHGDMGAAFDYNQDGKLDLLSGDDDNGKWHLYQNNSVLTDTHHLLVRVGYSESGVDPLGAKIEVQSASTKQYQIVGSHSASHSQSQLNIAHFGLAKANKVNSVTVTWRDGSKKIVNDINADKLIKIGKF